MTSYVSFEVLIEDVLRGVQWGRVAGALINLIDDMLALPMMQQAPAQMWTGAQSLKTRAAGITSLADKSALEVLLYEIVALRQLVPEAALNRVPRTGRNESTHGPGLQKEERRVVRGDAPTVTVGDVAFSMWKLLDFHPGDAYDAVKAAAVIANHLASMEMTYPALLGHFDGRSAEDLDDALRAQLETLGEEAHDDVFADCSAAQRDAILDALAPYFDSGTVPAIGGAFAQPLYVPPAPPA